MVDNHDRSAARRAGGFGSAFVVLSVAAVMSAGISFAQTKPAGEYQVKAAFLFGFAKFVDWPASTFSDSKQPLTVCVYGRDPFGEILDDALLGKSIGDRRISLGRANQFQDLAGCQMIFVTRSEHERAKELANRLAGRAVLLVGENQGFAISGGTIEFTLEDSRVHFIINPDAAERAGLKISSKLLALAKIVHDPGNSVERGALK
jgi:hypothetical protein